MYFRQFLDEHCGCASYLIASNQSREAAIVDPALETGPYQLIVRERGFHVRYVIDTHVHADHISGARRLAQHYGAALCLHAHAATTYAFYPLYDGDELALGELFLRILHTPGHRPELISLLVADTAGGAEPGMVLTGDSLLAGDVGRPDFGGGNAASQYDSVSRLLRLPEWVAVFPGHFEGPCGKNMSGTPCSTIGYERRYNPMARLNKERFITTLTCDVPARPLNMLAIEATNRGEVTMDWAMLATAPDVERVEPAALEIGGGDTVLLDVREPEEFVMGRMPGAHNIPQAELASRLAEVPCDRRVLIVCQAGVRSLRAAMFLKQIGYERVATVMGGMNAWRELGKPVEVGRGETGWESALPGQEPRRSPVSRPV